MPLDYVRVKDKDTGHHYSVLRQEAENNPDAYQVLKQDAVDLNGNPLPGEIPDSSSTTAAKTANTNTKES